MSKIITIGRGDGADIDINDELVSRKHATIRFLPFGRMELRDLSKNGTFVNGIQIPFNKPYKVSRKDVVSFARSSQLNWKDVPDPLKPYKMWGGVILGIIVIIVVYFILSGIEWGDSQEQKAINPVPDEMVIPSQGSDGVPSSPNDTVNKDENGIVRPDKYPDLFPRDKKKKDGEKVDEDKQEAPSQTEKPDTTGKDTKNWMI